MSDVNEKEAKWQDRLARSYKDYFLTVVCCVIGWTVVNAGQYAGGGGFVAFIGYLIMDGPVFLKMLVSRSVSALFFWRDYEVVTTYKDGATKSDGGVESAQMNFIMVLIMLGVCLVIGGIITAIKVFWLSAKTITSYVAVKQKPNFLFSPFPVLILGLVGFVAGAAIPQKIGSARAHAAYIERGGLTDEQIAKIQVDPTGSILRIAAPTLNLRSEPSGSGSVVKTLEGGDEVTATGKLSGVWVPVEHEGAKGYVYAPYVWLQKGNDVPLFNASGDDSKYPYQATVTSPIDAKKNVYGDNTQITLESGSVVTVTSCSASFGNSVYAYLKYNGVDYALLDGYNAEFIAPVK
jgi:uncharacterized protein YgiM (DUF1202 family)